MARHLRVEFPGAIYHVTCRMIGDRRLEGSRLFTDDAERERFLERLGERVEEYGVRLYLFVLMTNHFHLVFETPEGNCSRFMQSVLTSYTVYYNLRHGRHGHLLDGRYKAKVVEGDEYLLKLSRYVHLNPVMVGRQKDGAIKERVKYLRGYAWSTYPGYIGKGPRHEFVDYEPILAQMGKKRRKWERQYREFVETGLATTDEEFVAAKKASPRSVGSEGFREWVDELYEKITHGGRVREDVAFRRTTEPMKAEEVLGIVGEELGVGLEEFRRRRRESGLRAVAARFLMRYAGQTQRDVARILEAGSGSAISKQLTQYRDGIPGVSEAVLARLDARLQKARSERHAKPVNS